jgi:hypothetical protein
MRRLVSLKGMRQDGLSALDLKWLVPLAIAVIALSAARAGSVSSHST